MLEAESCQVCRQDKELDSDTDDSDNPDMSGIKSIPDHTNYKIRMEINLEEIKETSYSQKKPVLKNQSLNLMTKTKIR